MSTNILVLIRVFEKLTGIFGGFQNPMHYWGFSKPQPLIGIFRTPGINGGFRNAGY